MALELNYDVWGEGTDYSEHRVEWVRHPTSCLLIKLGGWTLLSRVGCPLHPPERERDKSPLSILDILSSPSLQVMRDDPDHP